MTIKKRILVPMEVEPKDLNSVHFALSLAERLEAEIYILQYDPGNGSRKTLESNYPREALSDLINTARDVGLTVSFHIVEGTLRNALIRIVKAEKIDMMVIGEKDDMDGELLSELNPMIPQHIIKVKMKDVLTVMEGR